MANDKTATFSIKVDADTKTAKAGVEDLDKFRKSIAASQDLIKAYSSNLKNLRGSSDQVKEAKAQLKAKIDAERDSVSRNTLAINNLGHSYQDLAKRSKILSSETGILKGFFTSGAIAIAGVAVVVAALTVAVLASTAAMVGFGIEAANTNRAMLLNLEAASGSAQGATALAHQVDNLAQKLPLPRERLAQLSTEMVRAFRQSKLSGQGIEDAFEAVSVAAAAGEEATGRTLQSILDRGKQFGRSGFGFFELRGSGLRFEDVVKSIATQTKRSMSDVTQAVIAGVVPVDVLAKAFKEVSHTRFDTVNAKRFLDLDTIAARFKSNITGLFRGANIEPFLATLSKLVGLFDQNTVTGKVLQDTISQFAGILNALATSLLPNADTGLRGLALGALKFTTYILKAALSVVQFFQSSQGIFAVKAALVTLATVAAGVVFIFATLATTAVILASPFIALVAIITKLATMKWGDIGKAIVTGLANGIVAAYGAVTGAIDGLADKIRNGLKGALGIHSPSTVGVYVGRNLSLGVAQGVKQESGAPKSAAVSMASNAAGGASAGGAASGGASSSPAVTVIFNVGGGPGVKEAASMLKEGSVLDLITHAVEIGLRSGGIPTQSPASS